MSKKSFRWGIDLLDEGHVPVYNFMLRHYSEAGLTRDEFLCILHLAAYHYESERGESRPALDTIAEEMGYGHKNSVYRLVASLRKKGMLKTTRRKGKTTVYNVAPFSQKVLTLWRQAQSGITQEGDTGEGDATVTLEGDTVSHRDVTEEKKQEQKAKNSNGATRPRDPYFDTVLEMCFGYKADSHEGQAIAKKRGSTIAKCATSAREMGRSLDDIRNEASKWMGWAKTRPQPHQLEGELLQQAPVTGSPADARQFTVHKHPDEEG